MPDKIDKDGIDRISEFASILDLPSYVEDSAKDIYKDAESVLKEENKNYTPSKIAGGSVHTACKLENIPRTDQEFEKAIEKYSISPGDVFFASINIEKKLDLDIEDPEPQEYIDRMSELLDLPEKIKKGSKELVEGQDNSLITAGPQRSAVAAIYKTSQENGRIVSLNSLAELIKRDSELIEEYCEDIFKNEET